MKLFTCVLVLVLSSIAAINRVWSIEITSALSVPDASLLLFTSQGLYLKLPPEWCTKSSCFNQTASLQPISNLWNHSKVVGLKRVDASSLVSGSFLRPLFLVLLQIQETNLDYIIVNNNLQRLLSYGTGASLLGPAWDSVPCMRNIEDLISDQTSIATIYIVCRDKSAQVYLLYQVSIELTTYRFHRVRLMHENSPISVTTSFRRFHEEQLTLWWWEYLHRHQLTSLKKSTKGNNHSVMRNIQAVELWQNKLVLFDGVYLMVVDDNGNDAIWKSSSRSIEKALLPLTQMRQLANIEPILRQSPLNGTTTMRVEPISSEHLDYKFTFSDRMYQMLQIQLTVFNILFLTGLLYGVWRAVSWLSDQLYEDQQWWTNDMWQSAYDRLDQ